MKKYYLLAALFFLASFLHQDALANGLPYAGAFSAPPGVPSTVLQGSIGTPTCGTGCSSVTAGSTDLRGSITSGSAVTSIVINFSGTLGFTPKCQLTGSAAVALGQSTSTSAETITAASAVTSDVITYACVQ